MKRKIDYLTIFSWFILAVGVLARVVMLTRIPGGVNQDEAFGAYEAYSLLHYGMDSSGYSFPVYLNTWGSGMSCLNSYLMIPFMWIMGGSLLAARMPMVIVSCLSLVVCYDLLKRLLGSQAALVGLTYLAVCPYHIMMSRWGLDCNLAPGFLLFAFYFFVRGVEKGGFYLLSAACYGLALYSYATVWPIVPVMILLQLLYVLYCKRLRFDGYLLGFVVILGLMAAPLIAFLLVNRGILEPFTIGKLTIPRLTAMRASDISFDNQKGNLKRLFELLINQSDDQLWNASERYGLYYKGFLVFGVLGLCYTMLRFIRALVSRKYDGLVLLIFPFVSAVALGSLIEVNVNRINAIHLPVILFISIGLYLTGRIVAICLRFAAPAVIPVTVAALLCLLGLFVREYTTSFRAQIDSLWYEGLEDATAYAMDIAGDVDMMYVDRRISYAQILFASKWPVTDYVETVRYTNYPSEFLEVSTFGQFYFNDNVTPGCLCIIPADKGSSFEENGFEVVYFENAAVAW